MATRDEIDRAIHTMLANGSAKQVGLVDPPAENPNMPYAVMMPGVIGPGKGSMDDTEGDEHDFLYTIICVGKDHRQCAAMSSLMHAVMTAKNGSGYVHPVALVGHAVQWRLSDSRGPVVRSRQGLWECHDTYRVRVGKSG